MNGSDPTTKTADQRDRLIEAVVAETAEHGYGDLTAERVAHKAGEPLASFYSHFADKQVAVEVAYERLFARYINRLLQTCKVQTSWPLKVRVGIGVTLDMAAADPVEARFVVEALLGNWNVPAGTIDPGGRLARLLAAGRTATPYGAQLPGVIEAALVGGIAGVVSAQLRGGEAKQLPALAPQLVELTLTPYLGHEAAAEVARRPRPRLAGL